MLNKQTTGFTLVELVIVIAIIGILATIVYPSYQENIKKSRRADAKGTLVGFASAMERHFTIASNYCDSASGTGSSAVANCGTATADIGTPTIYAVKSPVDGAERYYNLTINTVTVNPAGYILYAAPVNQQATDKCGTLTLTNMGVRGLVNQKTGVAAADCW